MFHRQCGTGNRQCTWVVPGSLPEDFATRAPGNAACNVSGALAEWAAGLFVLGAATMPLYCVIMAHRPKLHLIFSVPVVSLIAAAALTLAMILTAADVSPLNPQLSTLNPP